MPIYEYVCSKCNNKFELMRSFSQSSAPASCPKCKAESKRVLSRFSCFSAGSEPGSIPAPIGGGGGCSGCSSGSCGTCGM